MDDNSRFGGQSGSQLVSILRRFRWSTAAIVLAFVALSLAYSVQFQGDTTATGRMALADPRGNAAFGQGVTTEASFIRYVAQRADVAGSDEVLSAAADELVADGLDLDPIELRSRVETSGDDRGDVSVTARGEGAQEATAIANAVTDAYREVTLAQHASERESIIAAMEEARELTASRGESTAPASPGAQATAEALARIEIRLTDVMVDAETFGDGVLVVDQAVVSTATGGGTPLRNAIVGALIGLIFAIGIGFVRSEDLGQGRPLKRQAPPPGPDQVASTSQDRTQT